MWLLEIGSGDVLEGLFDEEEDQRVSVKVEGIRVHFLSSEENREVSKKDSGIFIKRQRIKEFVYLREQDQVVVFFSNDNETL
ncbi:hypothetical protein E2C01_005650 [Portunus trituberculatus]|uniref:Uncharacterized protein n=1 Tax=Portunus trituberculatus TaxID=210409 RepID=A0A5B7CZP7_PORTR|nr:hypothetical protein [Portunus trituberculatus]